MKREDLLDLNEAVQNPGKRLVFEIRTELSQEEDIDLVEPVTGSLQAVSTGNMLLVECDLSASCVVECARCGTPLTVSFDFLMDDQFPVDGIPSCYGSGGMAKVVPDEPYPLFQNNALMRDNYIRQGLILNLPVQTVCQDVTGEPCQGIRIVEKAVGAGHPAMEALGKIKLESEAE